MTPDQWLKSEFDRCSAWIEAALDRAPGEHTLAHVWKALDAGEAQLWPTPNSAVVTTLKTYPTGLKALVWWLAGGDLHELQVTERNVSAWARDKGCTRAFIHGRRGWLKALDGYRETSVTLTKEL